MNGRRFAIPFLWYILLSLSATAETPSFVREMLGAEGFSNLEIEQAGTEALVRELQVSDRTRSASFAGIIGIQPNGSRIANALDGLGPATHPDAGSDFGRFHEPARREDLTGLRFPEDDIDVLADCEVRNCKFKLSDEGIEELRKIDWDRDDAGEVFTERFRRRTLAYVQRYRREGNRGLIRYADKPEPVALMNTVESILDQEPAFRRHAPTLSTFLRTYPEGGSPAISESIVWSIKDFGFRPTLSVDHIFVDRSPEPKGVTHLIAIKTIYANHYLAGRLQLVAILDGKKALGIPGDFVVLVDRIEFDDTLGRVKRSLLTRGLLADVEDRLQRLASLADGAR